MHAHEKVLCWDFDDTLGRFAEERIPILRYGIRDLLKEFSTEAGYKHFITTGSDRSFAQEMLNKTHLTPFFREVFGFDTTLAPEWGKLYKPVAETLNYSEDDMRAYMIAIGDAQGDQAVDVDMVFLQVDNPRMDALVVREIITELLDKGHGHFRDGFENLYLSGVPKNFKYIKEDRRIYHLSDLISFELKHEVPGSVGLKIGVPVITNIEAPSYIR